MPRAVNQTMIQERLFALADEAYKAFSGKLIPTVDGATIIGVRSPAIAALARELAGTREADAFLCELPHAYHDENNLHAALISRIRGYDACLAAVEAFLPYVDNWSTCDSLAPAALAREPDRLARDACAFARSDKPYTARFGIRMLMNHFLDERFQPEYMALVAGVRSEEYYVDMMVAWYFATALAKQYDAAISYIRADVLPAFARRKAIQKALESYRVSEEHKRELRACRAQVNQTASK